jgi:anaerobic selenocysteine-containing dehydrogenase
LSPIASIFPGRATGATIINRDGALKTYATIFVLRTLVYRAIRNPDWRRKGAGGALRINPEDAESVGVADGKHARLSTRRGSVEVLVQVAERMQRGHLALPNGLGLDFPGRDGQRVQAGVGPNELTGSEDRDWIAGTPWHKSTPARIEPL